MTPAHLCHKMVHCPRGYSRVSRGVHIRNQAKGKFYKETILENIELATNSIPDKIER